jgi:tRNA(fMet)-specific endonuclease VapC
VNQLFMIDTNTISYIVKGSSPAARAKLAGLATGEIACLSAITEAELAYGLSKSPKAERLRPAIEGLLAKLQILPWGREAAQVYGQLRARQEAAGKPLGNLDLLIAAHALASGAVLVTNDKSFAWVSGLVGIVSWATDR